MKPDSGPEYESGEQATGGFIITVFLVDAFRWLPAVAVKQLLKGRLSNSFRLYTPANDSVGGLDLPKIWHRRSWTLVTRKLLKGGIHTNKTTCSLVEAPSSGEVEVYSV